jgi:hypothetical protein
VHRFLSELTGGFHFIQYASERSTPLPAVLSRFPSAGGHIRLADFINDLDPFVIRLTLLRDPLSRLLSHYSFLQSPTHSSRDPLVRMARTETLSRLSASGDRWFEILANQQCWYLSTEPASAPMELHCRSAKQNLSEFQVVGWTERLEDSLKLLPRMCGAHHTPHIPHFNQTNGRLRPADFSPDEVAQLRYSTRFDEELCAFARELPADRPRAAHQHRSLPFASLSKVLPTVHGTRKGIVESVSLRNKSPLLTGDRALVEVAWRIDYPVESVVMGFVLRDFVGRIVYGTNTSLLNVTLPADTIGSRKTYFSFDAVFEPGLYYIDVALQDPVPRKDEVYHWVERAASFELMPSSRWTHEGFVDTHASFEDTTAIGDMPLGKEATFRIWIDSPPAKLPASTSLTIPVQVYNGADYPIATFGQKPFHLSYRWLRSPDLTVYEAEGIRTPLFPAHRSRTLRCWPLDVSTPAEPGCYCLRLFIVQENVRWIDAPELHVDRDYVFEITPLEVSTE